jgi:hypothetical protein
MRNVVKAGEFTNMAGNSSHEANRGKSILAPTKLQP